MNPAREIRSRTGARLTPATRDANWNLGGSLSLTMSSGMRKLEPGEFTPAPFVTGGLLPYEGRLWLLFLSKGHYYSDEALLLDAEGPAAALDFQPIAECKARYFDTAQTPMSHLAISMTPFMRAVRGGLGPPDSDNRWIYTRLVPRRCPAVLRLYPGGASILWCLL